MWVTKLLISPVKKRIFCPKTTKFGPKLAFLVNLGQAMQAYSVPCWGVGWWLWRAGCISQDTYLLYLFFLKERLARLACIKRTVEDQNPAPPYYSVPRTDVNQVNLKVFAITPCFQSDPCFYFLSPSIKDITFFS